MRADSTNTVPVQHKPSTITVTKAVSISAKRDGRFILDFGFWILDLHSMPPKSKIQSCLLLVVELGEAVADAVHHLNVAGVVGVVFDLAPQVLDVRVNRTVVALETAVVHALDQLGASEWPAG